MIKHLAAAEAYVRLSQQANRLRQLQILLEECLPVYLQPGTRIANFKRGKIVIHAASGAVAVKLRQLAPSLTESLGKQAPELTGIEVKVQAHRAGMGNSRPKEPRSLGMAQQQVLTSLSAGLREGSALKGAIDRLLSRCR